MGAQQWVVALVVLACSLRAAWLLMPAAGRRRVAAALLKAPWPAPLRQRLQRQVLVPVAAGGCGGCNGCAGATARPGQPKACAPGVQPVHFQRRPPR